MQLLPKKIGSGIITAAAVYLNEKVKGRDVDGIDMFVTSAAVLEKLILSASLKTEDGNPTRDLFTSIPVRALASIADHDGGMGYAGGLQLSDLIAEILEAGATNPHLVVDAALCVHLDIGRINLKDGEELDITIASTTDLSAGQSVFAQLPATKPALERVYTITRDTDCDSSYSDPAQVWIIRNAGSSVDPYTLADGNCVVEVTKDGNLQSCQVREVFAATAARGNYETARPTEAALLFRDTDAAQLGGFHVKLSGSDADEFYLLAFERVLDASRAIADRSRVQAKAITDVAKLERTSPGKAMALRAGFNLPTVATLVNSFKR